MADHKSDGPTPSPRNVQAASSPAASRIGFVDALRGLAIVLMVLVHVARAVVDPDEPGAAGAFRSLLMTTEPLISTLFLTLVGVSLVLAHGRSASGRAWWRSRIVRALTLVLLSWGIFWVHGGINPPYPFLSAEILYTIGLAVLLYAPVVHPNGVRWWLLALLGALLAAATALAEAYPREALSRLAQGPGAHLPNLLFPALGILLAWTWHRRKPETHWGGAGTGGGAAGGTPAAPAAGRMRGPGGESVRSDRAWLWWRRWMLPLGLVVVLAYHFLWAPANQERTGPSVERPSNIEAVFNRPHGRTAASRELVTDGQWGSTYDLRWVAGRMGLADPPPRIVRSRAFWNKKLALVPYLSAWMLVLFGLAMPGASRRKGALRAGPPAAGASPSRPFFHFLPGRVAPGEMAPLLQPLHLLGRHALKLYVFHLALAALLSFFPGIGVGMGGYLACVAAVLLACSGLAWGVEAVRK